jgi:hypothetical protein
VFGWQCACSSSTRARRAACHRARHTWHHLVHHAHHGFQLRPRRQWPRPRHARTDGHVNAQCQRGRQQGGVLPIRPPPVRQQRRCSWRPALTAPLCAAGTATADRVRPAVAAVPALAPRRRAGRQRSDGGVVERALSARPRRQRPQQLPHALCRSCAARSICSHSQGAVGEGGGGEMMASRTRGCGRDGRRDGREATRATHAHADARDGTGRRASIAMPSREGRNGVRGGGADEACWCGGQQHIPVPGDRGQRTATTCCVHHTQSCHPWVAPDGGPWRGRVPWLPPPPPPAPRPRSDSTDDGSPASSCPCAAASSAPLSPPLSRPWAPAVVTAAATTAASSDAAAAAMSA